MNEVRPRLTPYEFELVKRYRANKPEAENRLIIGDLHAPFTLDGYLEFCQETADIWNCNAVTFIGDIIDNHFSSYHETSADGMGGAYELDMAAKEIAKWYKAFPDAEVIIGNHDRLIMRKAQTGGIPSAWIRDYKEVLNTPKWEFKGHSIHHGVMYIHGEGGTARSRAKADMQSVVQGHLHTQAYTEWQVGNNFRIFGMQVGCGINKNAYPMAYAKDNKKPAIGCGVVLNNGTQPFNVLMNL